MLIVGFAMPASCCARWKSAIEPAVGVRDGSDDDSRVVLRQLLGGRHDERLSAVLGRAEWMSSQPVTYERGERAFGLKRSFDDLPDAIANPDLVQAKYARKRDQDASIARGPRSEFVSPRPASTVPTLS
jgi:hypothetical protein